MVERRSTNKMHYDQYNIHGSILCNAVGCRKHKRLYYRFGGKFCQKHIDKLSDIRASLQYAKNTKNIYLEQYYRQQEIEFRKFPEKNHMHYQVRLEDYLLSL